MSLAVELSWPEMRYHFMWFFIAAALQSRGSFPFWESEKSIHVLTELPQSKDNGGAVVVLSWPKLYYSTSGIAILSFSMIAIRCRPSFRAVAVIYLSKQTQIMSSSVLTSKVTDKKYRYRECNYSENLGLLIAPKVIVSNSKGIF